MTIFDQLRAPFPASALDWRVGSTTAKKDRGLALPYLDARAVRRRLNEVLGDEGWEVSFRPCVRPGSRGWVCSLTVRVPHSDGTYDRLIREDVADESDMQPSKGAASGAFKRAAAMFGVGDYLYDLDPIWAPIQKRGNSYVLAGSPPVLPHWALPADVGAKPGGAAPDVREERGAPSLPVTAPESLPDSGEAEGWNPQPDPGEGDQEAAETFGMPYEAIEHEPPPVPAKGKPLHEIPVNTGSVQIPWEAKIDANSLCPVEEMADDDAPWLRQVFGFGKKVIASLSIANWTYADILQTDDLMHDAPEYLIWYIECREPPDRADWIKEHNDRISKSKAVLLALAARQEGAFPRE